MENIQAKIPLYIRFGDIPSDGQSEVHFGDQIVRKEGGVSVYKAVEANGMYFPILPDEPSEHSIADYFNFLLKSDKKVYLVIGDEIRIEGADREPLLINVKIIKDITHYYRNIEKYNTSDN